jgi:rhodanese-related sulfurtransferase
LDVREVFEHEAERITSARLTPLSALQHSVDGIDRERPVYLLCRSGNRAAQAAERLAGWGFKDVRVIRGGLQAWSAEGLATEKGQNRMWSLERQVRFAAGFLVLSGVLLSLLSPWFILLSGFVGSGLMFSAVTDTCAMGMLLARMPWNRLGSNNTSSTLTAG